MGEADRRRGNSRQRVRNDNSGPQQYWVQRRTIRPCCRCESDVLCERHVYKIKERKNEDINSMINEPKRHIILSGKINIVGIEDKSDMSEDYERNVRIPPFIVKKDPSIMLNDEDTPWLRQDHNQGSYVKKKFTVVPA